MWVTPEKEEESCEFIRNLFPKGGKIAWFCSQASLGQKPATGPCLVNLLVDSLMNHYLYFRTKYEILVHICY